jgi:hypothetical protein
MVVYADNLLLPPSYEEERRWDFLYNLAFTLGRLADGLGCFPFDDES